MNYFKRSMTSMKRKPGKTIILMALIFILGNLMVGSLLIPQAVSNTEANLNARLPGVATIEVDYESMMAHESQTGEWPLVSPLSPEVIREIGELDYVRTYDYSMSETFFSSDLYRHWNPEFSDDSPWNGDDFQDAHSLRYWGLDFENFDLKGVHNSEILDIQEGIIELVAGRTFSEEEMSGTKHAALISRELAERNNLNIGSKITLESRVYDLRDADESSGLQSGEQFKEEHLHETKAFEIEIAGIYELLAESITGEEWLDVLENQRMLNRIYVPNSLTEAAKQFIFDTESDLFGEEHELSDEDKLSFQAIYILESSRDLSSFTVTGNEMLPEFWQVNTLVNMFEEISSSMDNMAWIANMVLVGTAGATIIITSLLIILSLRDRKGEIGIYLALGEKKSRVIFQIIFEVLAPAIIAITLSLFTGGILAKELSQTMLMNDLTSQVQEDFSHDSSELDWFSKGEMSIDEMMANYEIKLEGQVIVMYYGLSIGVVLVASAIPVIYITRLDPKKIMM